MAAGAAAAALHACGVPDRPAAGDDEVAVATPSYRGAQVRLFDATLVNFLVEMRGAKGVDDVEAYARCVAAGYARIRGYGFARHVRTNVDEEGGVWRADAVYTISPEVPDGDLTIDAEVVVAACEDAGIPTV